MKIAICSQNRKHVTPHAGRCRHFMVFDVQGEAIHGPESLELPMDSTLHELSGDAPHPLDGIQVLIAGSMGGCAIRKLAARGILGLITDEPDPLTAVQRYLQGTLPELDSANRALSVCSCSH